MSRGFFDQHGTWIPQGSELDAYAGMELGEAITAALARRSDDLAELANRLHLGRCHASVSEIRRELVAMEAVGLVALDGCEWRLT
jgi:hypothetical protein